MKQVVFSLFCLAVFFCAGCVTDPKIGPEHYPTGKVENASEIFLSGGSPYKRTAYGIVPGIYSAYFAGLWLDEEISDVRGINIADLYTQNESVSGVNLSGGFSKNDTLDGFSLVGISSFSGNFSCIEFAGLSSVVRRNAEGVQFGGLLSTAGRNAEGVQFGGLLSKTKWDMTGFQFSGLFCLVGDEMTGVQLSGLLNGADDLDGVQLSTINLAVGDTKGLQLGAVNYVHNVSSGLQLGAFNIAEDRILEKVDSRLVENESGEFVEEPVYSLASRFSFWQFGALNRTTSGWWIPVTNLGFL